MRSHLSRTLLVVLALVCVAVWCACPALAQTRTYSVQHSFNITPGGNIRPWVTGSYYDYGFVNQVGAIATNTTFGTVTVRPGGINQTFGVITWPPLPSQVQANSTVIVQPFGIGTPVTGSTRSWGSITVSGQHPVIADAQSTTTVTVVGRARLRSGRIVWLPAITDSTQGGTRWNNDPVMFRVKDMQTGQIVDETAVNIRTTITGNGSVSWEAGTLNVNGLDAESLSIEATVGGPHVEQSGNMMLQIIGGLVAFSDDNGIFDGVLPPIGMPGTFMVPIIPSIILDYNLGDFNGHPLEVYVHMGGGAGEPFPPQYVDNLLDVKELPDDTQVHITKPKVVTTPSGAYIDGRIYIEEPTRASGVPTRAWAICVHPNGLGPFSQNDQVELSGYVRTDPFSTERYLDLSAIDSQAPGLVPFRKLAMGNKAAAITDETAGIDLSGYYVTVWGKITYREAHGRYIYIDDCSGLSDGSLGAGPLDTDVEHKGLRVVLDAQTVPIAVPAGADYAVVSGPRGMADGGVPCVLPINPDVVSFFDVWPGGDDQ